MNLFTGTENSDSKCPVEFKAGKCVREDNQIRPDLRKGLIYMELDQSSLLHFYWKERTTSTPEDDFIIFPEEATFSRVPECTTGRVYVLAFKSSNQKLFYWMQDANTGNDVDNVEAVNKLINDPTSAGEGGQENLAETASDVLNVLTEANNGNPIGINHEQILQYLQSMGGLQEQEDSTQQTAGEGTASSQEQTAREGTEAAGEAMNVEQAQRVESTAETATQPSNITAIQTTTSAPATSTPGPTGHFDEQQLNQMRNILAGIQVPEAYTEVNLANVLTPSAIKPLLEDPEICSMLFPLLPDTIEHNPRELAGVISSPQFAQSLQSLSAALRTGQLGPLMGEFGLDPSAGYSVEGFLRAIQEQAKKADKDDSMDTS